MTDIVDLGGLHYLKCTGLQQEASREHCMRTADLEQGAVYVHKEGRWGDLSLVAAIGPTSHPLRWEVVCLTGPRRGLRDHVQIAALRRPTDDERFDAPQQADWLRTAVAWDALYPVLHSVGRGYKAHGRYRLDLTLEQAQKLCATLAPPEEEFPG
jgi:hypothetical protein